MQKNDILAALFGQLLSSGNYRQIMDSFDPERAVELLRAHAHDPQVAHVLGVYDDYRRRQPFLKADRSAMQAGPALSGMHDTMEAAERVAFDALEQLASIGMADSELAASASLAIGCSRYVAGQVTQAAGYLSHALEIRSKRLGVRHPEYLVALYHWSQAQIALGWSQKTMARVEEAISGSASDSSEVASLCELLGNIYLERRDLRQARPLLERALRVRLATGARSREAVEAATQLARLELLAHRPAEATRVIEQARQSLPSPPSGELWELGARFAAESIAADVASLNGDHRAAVEHLRRARAFARQYGVPRDTRIVGCTLRLAESLEDLGEAAEAVNEIRTLIEEGAGLDFLPDADKRRALLVLRRNYELLPAAAVTGIESDWIHTWARQMRREYGFADEDRLIRLSQQFWMALRSHLLFLWQLTQPSEADRAPSDILRKLWNEAYGLVIEFKGAVADSFCVLRERRLAVLHPEHREDLERLLELRRRLEDPCSPASPVSVQREREDLEEKLRRAIPEMDSETCRYSSVSVDESLLAIDPGAVLVDFVQLGNAGTDGLTPFLAFVFPAGRFEHSQILPLAFDAQHVFALREALREESRSGVSVDADPVWDNVWEPVERVLAELRTAFPEETFHRVFLSPDGPLSLVSFAALRSPNGRFLLDDYEISYLTSAKDLLSIPDLDLPQGSAPVAIGIAEFNGPSPQPPTASRAADRRAFSPLKHAETEAKRVSARLGGGLRLGAQASKASLVSQFSTAKESPSPVVLHFATHGFCFAQSDDALEIASRLSGLAVAGANHGDEGVLTAREISALDLHATQMAVLSACETAGGAVAAGEGVFGLQRAFRVAGTRSLVMALWSIDDSLMPSFMDLFYANLQSGLTRSAALRQAQLNLRQRMPFAWHWGAMICQGNPLAISSLTSRLR